METNARYVLVGISAVILILLTTGGLLWLRKSGRDSDTTLVTVRFKDQSLSGLREGSAVTMRGISVGTVKSLSFDSQDTSQVKAVIGVSKTAPVRTDSEVTIQRSLVTGLSTIDLTTGSTSAPLLVAGSDTSENYPELLERLSQFDTMRDAAPELLHQSSEIMRHIHEFLSDDNRDQVTQILRNVQTITARLASPETGIDKTLAEVRAAATEFKAVSSDARAMVGSIGGSVSKLNTLFERLTSMVGESVRVVSDRISDMARAVQEATAKLGNPRKILTGPSVGELGPGEDGKK